MGKIRPRINDNFIVQIRERFPTETALMGNEQVIEWALGCFVKLTGPAKGGYQDGNKKETRL